MFPGILQFCPVCNSFNKPLSLTDKNGTITREYDELNRVTKYTDTFGNEIGYEYDKIGNLIKLTYPDGTAVKYTYDANNNMTSVTDWAGRVTRYTYDENNLVTKVVKPDKSVTTTTYDTAHRITSSVERRSTGSLISGYKYTFDDLGRISTESCLDKGTKFWYTYDSLSRIVHKLTTDLYGNHMYEESYEYDAAGNIRYTTDNCCEENSYSYTSNNRLKSYNGYNVGFDEDGNMLYFYQDGTKCSLTYDSSNRLLSAKSCKYTYNAENTRIKKVYGSTATTYVYNTVAKLSQLLVMKKGSTITKYVYGLGLIGEECNGAFKTYHFDYRGSTVALTNINGVVTNIFTYDTYGKLTEGSSSVTPFLYNGRDGVITDENGLYYMRARYYSPDLRRFVNADIVRGAISDGVTLNRYAYANCNPITNIDPLGLEGIDSRGTSASESKRAEARARSRATAQERYTTNARNNSDSTDLTTNSTTITSTENSSSNDVSFWEFVKNAFEIEFGTGFGLAGEVDYYGMGVDIAFQINMPRVKINEEGITDDVFYKMGASIDFIIFEAGLSFEQWDETGDMSSLIFFDMKDNIDLISLGGYFIYGMDFSFSLDYKYVLNYLSDLVE